MGYQDSYQAWLIALATSLLCFLMSGNTRHGGVLYVPLMETEQIDRGTAAWPFSLVGAATIVAGPLAGFLRSRLSPVVISLLGSFLFVSGQLPGYFTTNIYVLSFFYGLVKGFGIGMLLTIGAIVTSASFNRFRSTAMGLSMVGGSIGGVIFPILAQFMLMEYCLRGTFLLMAGISMNSFVFSLAYMWFKDNEPSSKALCDNSGSKIEDERTPLLSSLSDTRRKNSYVESKIDNLGSHVIESHAQKHLCKGEKCFENNIKTSPKETQNWGDRQQTDISEFPANSQTNNFLMTKRIFTKRGFYIVALNQIVFAAVPTIIAQVLLDDLNQRGISETVSVYMLSLVSVGDIIGKVCFGMILDKKILSFANHLTLFLILGAAADVVLTLSVNIPALLIVSIIVGASAGTLLSVNLVFVTEYVSNEENTLAQSFLKGFQGIGILATSPVIGLFRDTLGSYEYLYYFLIILQLALALVNFIEGIYFRFKKSNVKTIS